MSLRLDIVKITDEFKVVSIGDARIGIVSEGRGFYICKDNDERLELISRPKKVKRWVNLYKDSSVDRNVYGSMYETEEIANTKAATNLRIACVEIEVDEGVL